MSGQPASRAMVIGDAPLTIEQVVAVARGGAQVSLGRAALDRIASAHEVIARVIAEEQVAYGVTTGFGLLATTHIPAGKVKELQENLVRSHAVGVGAPLACDSMYRSLAVRLLAALSVQASTIAVRLSVTI